jgi:hypothetical protein
VRPEGLSKLIVNRFTWKYYNAEFTGFEITVEYRKES